MSRRAIMERIRDNDRDKIISKIKEGDIVQGIVKILLTGELLLILNG